MVDLRTVAELSPLSLSKVEWSRGAFFRWTQWNRPHEGWTHDHCDFCSACICDHRDRDPHDKPGPVEGGHYRHAYYADALEIWVCRSCFKRIAPVAGWSVRRAG